MNNKIELFAEPLEIKKLLTDNGAEMSDLQHSLMCGLIKQYEPKKIVEVGVAAGGTTAVLLSCVSMLGLDSEVYSIDHSEKYYRDNSKKTGYLAEECKKYLDRKVRHYMQGGGYLPEYLNRIGDNIDFLILDTVHSLPGELFDFLAALPKLRDGAIVVLHDIFLNHISGFDTGYAVATRVLLSSVVGNKIICRGEDNKYNYIGLGVFEITKETRQYIENVFSALMLTWNYMPDFEQLDLYRQWFLEHYSYELVEEFDVAVDMNKNTFLKVQTTCSEGFHNICGLLHQLKDRENVYIYGCGVYGRKLYDCLESMGLKIEGYVISDGQIKPDIDKKVEFISDIETSDSIFILGMNAEKQREICKESVPDNWICIDESILYFLWKCL